MNTTPIPRLVRYLYSLVESRPEPDRAALAALRASLREDRVLEAARFVFPHLPTDPTREDEDAALLLAGLFALHPERGTLTLASALQHVQTATDSESVEARFRALLTADRDELPVHLRNAISLVASHRIAVDWADLYRAIRGWRREGPRRRWASQYWSPSEPTAETSPERTV